MSKDGDKVTERIYEQERPKWINSLNQDIPPEIAGRIIGRYFNLSGFLNMLKTSELRLKKISDFEDKAEGVPQYSDIIHALEQSEKNAGTVYANNRKENIIRTIDNYYASCWTMNDHESYLMWKNYASYYEGVLVLTTVEQLLSSLELKSYEEISDSPSVGTIKSVNCFFGNVDYGYQNKIISDHNKAFGKSVYFKDENEFRIVIYHHPIIEKHDYRCVIKNFSFINSIVCSPKSTQEFTDLIKKIAIDYSLPESIVKESGIKQNSKEILEKFISDNIDRPIIVG